MPAWLFRLNKIQHLLWVRAAASCVLAIVAALVSASLAPLVPSGVAAKIGGESVEDILAILAGSMLAVATFSLTTLVTAYTSINGSATPRVANLLVAGGRGQDAHSVFIGAFLYSVIALVALHTGYYGPEARSILLIVTILVIALIVAALLSWINELVRIGRLDVAVDRVEAVTREAFRSRLINSPHDPEDRKPCPDAALAVDSDRIGYVQNIDLDRLERLVLQAGAELWIDAMPGAFVHREHRLFRLTGARPDPAMVAHMKHCFQIGDERTFKQDPRFGLVVLAEIAARAMSPAINDPGTAIDVIGTAVRVLTEWACDDPEHRPRTEPQVHAPYIRTDDLFDDVFRPVAQYGAGDLAVAVRLQKALAALSRLDAPTMAQAAAAQSAEALTRAEGALQIERDRERVREAAATVTKPSQASAIGSASLQRV